MNKLPEKLSMLRKYNNLSQGDIASRLSVPVTEYMQWENGNNICSIQYLKKISDIFGVSLDDLLDNTKTIVIPEPKLDRSVNIPFHGGQDINATQVYGQDLGQTMQATQQFTAFNNSDSEDGRTRVMDTSSISNVDEPQQQNYDVEDEDEEEYEEQKPVGKKKKPQRNDKKKKQTMIIISAVAALICVIAVVIFLLTNVGSNLTVGSENRIAVGDTYSLYVDNQGSIKKYGNFNPSTAFTNAVQVSAFDDHAVALLSNGTVVSSDGNSEVSSWKNIQHIAAGKDHTVGVTEEGKVECAGNADACKVSSWSNISSVYAGNGFTIGLTNDGAVKASGNNTDAVANLSNVRHISASDNSIVVTKKDGTVTVYPIGSSSTVDTSTWTDIQSTAVGNNLVVGLKKDGTVNISYSDEEVVNKVASWKNIKYIAANGTTVVGIDSYGKMHGAGDNTYSQYVDTTSDDSKSDTVDQLDEVKNIQVNATTANVVIKWDTVENASYYEVSISTSPETSTKTSSNSTSIPSSSLTDGESYTVTVTAKSDNENVKESSATYTFTYTAMTVQLSTPSGITATTTNDGWMIQWTAVEHATSYKLSIDGGAEFEVESNSYTDTGMEQEGNHTVTIKACSSDTTYTESEVATTTLQYTTQSIRISLYYVDGNKIYKGDTTVMAKVGLNYTWKDLDALAGNFAASQGWTVNDGTTRILSGTSVVNITVTDSGTPVEGQQ